VIHGGFERYYGNYEKVLIFSSERTQSAADRFTVSRFRHLMCKMDEYAHVISFSFFNGRENTLENEKCQLISLAGPIILGLLPKSLRVASLIILIELNI